MKTLSKRQVLLLHSSLIEAFGGSDGVRDEGLLESALATPFQTFDGEPVYPSVQSKAAQLVSDSSATILLWMETSGSALMSCWSFSSSTVLSYTIISRN